MKLMKMGLVSALMLALSGSSAYAGGDIYGDYRGSIKDDVSYDAPERKWYLRGDFGIGFNSDPDFTDSAAATFFRDDADESWSIGGGIGYHLMRGFRMDLTLDYRMNEDLYSQLPPPATLPLAAFTGDLDTLVGLANFYYDFDMGHRITPYVGVGVGFAHHDISGDDTSDSDTSFAWALMAGVDIDLRDRWKLDIGYRYLDMGDGDFTDKKTPGRYFVIDDLESHEIRVGLRYSFSCLRSCETAYEPMK